MRKHVLETASIFIFLMTSLALVAFVPAQQPAYASSETLNRSIAFYPEESGAGTFISLNIEPGETAVKQVVLRNTGEIEQSLRTYPVAATSGVNGGFVLREYGTEMDEITGWLDYPETVHTFVPGESVSIPVRVSVPSDAKPGEYVTGLAAEQQDSFEVPGTELIEQRVRWSIPILIVVPGDREPSFELGNATIERRESFVIAEIEIGNPGNVIVRPEGEVRLLDRHGAVLGVANVRLDSVYAGTSTTFIVAWENAPESEAYSLDVSLSSKEDNLSIQGEYQDMVPVFNDETDKIAGPPLTFPQAKFSTSTDENPPLILDFAGEISNIGEPIENARVSIVTYQDGVEVDRYPIMQAVTIEQGTTPVEARYSLPGGFTEGTYTFEVTIDLGDSQTQTVLVTQPIDYEVVVP